MAKTRHKMARCRPYHAVNAQAILHTCISCGDQGFGAPALAQPFITRYKVRA